MVNGWYRCLTESGTGGCKHDWIMTFHIFPFHHKGMSSVFLIDEVHDFSCFFLTTNQFFLWKIYGQRRFHQENAWDFIEKNGWNHDDLSCSWLGSVRCHQTWRAAGKSSNKPWRIFQPAMFVTGGKHRYM
jgi:hypothetical protein